MLNVAVDLQDPSKPAVDPIQVTKSAGMASKNSNGITVDDNASNIIEKTDWNYIQVNNAAKRPEVEYF